ncbi:uncharacterized protein K460DRAFT_407234 [Cucurbitaria berberidis CBS 394.84]|uniref:Uncharacterized protein n=1 Tax=Cucurbitaria berberidis CBS 394.84 TaxID=1168544 RepID=A0A9P4GC66_9PLEO|nr:uncharacterized protein K460DRAFT_407234 [Cucurbitaria berberidis CBS 394.84]KAF1842851.1 hypothetical protein K460DRAFT_407234 [Cucurbitaria berberidis CBS 394.84]
MRRHFRKSSGEGSKKQHHHHHAERQSSSQTSQTSQPAPPKLQRTSTAPEAPPSLLRLPSTSSTAPSASSRSRRTTNPSTPTAPYSASAATSPSYFSPQPQATPAQSPRSPPPGTRRPPASHSGHGIDNSRGPPVTLLTRGNSDIARRSTQNPADFAFAQQQFVQLGLVPSSGSGSGSSSQKQRSTRRRESVAASDAPQTQQQQPQPQQQQANTPAPAVTRRNSTSSSRPAQPMASSMYQSSKYEPGPRGQLRDPRHDDEDSSSTDGEQTEDLFMKVAADSAPRPRPVDPTARMDRLKSRLARVNGRQSLPSAPSPVYTPSTTPITTRIPTSAEPRSSGQRRASHLPTSSRNIPERSSPSPALSTPRTRPPELSHKASFSSRKDTELSPRDFLAQFQRRPSQPDTLLTPPARTGTYRPSNLNYSSSRDDSRTPHMEPAYETASRADGTESHGSTGPAASVWDELDELKTRIRKIEKMGGKIPATSNAIMSQAAADRPRTANTSATTVSSSPKQQRKSNISPPESAVETQTPTGIRIHPLLREALAKAKHHILPSVYRALEATASEALTLAEMTGSAGPQGTFHSASSILGSTGTSDRQVRRKADNICRSLTELCIAMCDNNKTDLASPALRTSAATVSRRPSVQINGDSPTVRQSIEPESNTISGVSPSRALSRIEARRSSMLAGDVNGSQRDRNQAFDDRETPSRLQRAGTSFHRTRESMNDDEEYDPTLRAPSRAMSDFRSVRSLGENRYSSGRQYTSREPMPELQPSPALQPTPLARRPTVTGVTNENSLLYRDGPRRYDFRESSPAYEKQMSGGLRAQAQFSAARNPNRNSIGGIADLGRSVSLGRRMRGSSTGE